MNENAVSRSHRRHGIGRAILRRLPLIGTMLGLGLGVWLVATHDLGAIAAAFGQVGWFGLAAIVLVRVLNMTLCGIAWARILARLADVQLGAFIILRFVREGINQLLPVAQVGGEFVGGRLLTFWGVRGALAAASLLADMLIQVSTQLLFTLLGVALLHRVSGEAAASLAGWMLHAAWIAALLLGGFFAFQRFGPAGLVERGLARIGGSILRESEQSDGPDRENSLGIQAALDRVWGKGRSGPLLQSAFLHLAAWTLGAVEIFIALTCIGIEISWAEAVMLESLAQAIKAAAFPVPAGLGVQEGGFVLVGALFGIEADVAIALSLVKRVPDIVLGIPSLLYWQTLEAKRSTVLPQRG